MTEEFYWEKYKWEFMRRSAEFRRAYQEYQDAIEKDLKDKPRYASATWAIMYKWGYHPFGGVRFPNPYNSFEEEFKPEEVRLYFHKNFDVRIDGSVLILSINLHKINSVDELKKQIVSELEIGLKDIKKKGLETKSRKRVEYDVMLEVGDLKEKGWTYLKIAKKIFPRDFNDNNEKANPESAKSKVAQYYKKYRDLVNGGYKNVNFP